MRLIGKDMKSFICPHCCPYRNIRDSDPEPYFTLREYNNKAEIADMDVLKRKMGAQLSAVANFHAGLFDLLAQLKEIPLDEIIRNKPSENIKRGNISSKVTDSDILKEIEENNKKMRGKPRKEGVSDRDGGDFSLEIAGNDEEDATDTVNQPPVKKLKTMPFFIGGSRVYGSSSSALSGSADVETLVTGNNDVINSMQSADRREFDTGVVTAKGYRFGESGHVANDTVHHTFHSVMAPTIVNGIEDIKAAAEEASKLSVPKNVSKGTAEEELQNLADIEWEE